jgi:hypothetical protein
LLREVFKMNKQDAQRILDETNPDAARKLVLLIAEELDGRAAQVWCFGLSEGPRRALGLVAQMAGELAVCEAQLYDAERWYAGAALVRQLIETEYLMFLFAIDHDEPERWLKASGKEARDMFAPAKMRERSAGRFNASEYSTHCEVGGHPRPAGHFLLKEHIIPIEGQNKLFDPRVQWVDLAQHLDRLWIHYVVAVGEHSPSNIYPEQFRKIHDAIVEWRALNPSLSPL